MARTTSPKVLISVISSAPSFLISLQISGLFGYFIMQLSLIVTVLFFVTILYLPPSKIIKNESISKKS
jgi:hypothetical protein